MPLGRLFVVATPIGNLEDISDRARTTLRHVTAIACEDSRRAKKLIDYFALGNPRLVVLAQHNEDKGTAQVMDILLGGEDVALTSDAGTPLISDPGHQLIRAAFSHGVRCSPIPGPSALSAIASISPIPVTDLRFVGFLPPRATARKSLLTSLLATRSSIVFFVPTRSLTTVLGELVELQAADREILVARELTKLNETIVFDTVSNALASLSEHESPRGEATCILSGTVADINTALLDQLIDELKSHLKPRDAAGVAARVTGTTRNFAYARLLELQSQKH